MKKSYFIFYWIELAVRRGRRREWGWGVGGRVLIPFHARILAHFMRHVGFKQCFTRHALKGKTSNLNLPRLSVKISASRTDLIMRFVKKPFATGYLK